MTTTPTPRRTEQLMLAGQAAAPDGPVDLTVMFLVHRGFRRSCTTCRLSAWSGCAWATRRARC